LLHQANVELGRKQLELQQALAQLQKSHAELKAAQFQLIQAEKMQSLGRLAAGVAHEVKNPLAILGMGIEYLAKNLASPDEHVAAILADMTEACKRADAIIKDMLDFSAPRALDLQAQNLNDIISHSLGLLRRHLSTSAIRVLRDLAPLPPLQLDRNKIQQVFLNLLANAMHAMPQGGTLIVRTYTRELAPGEIDSEAQQRFGDRFRAGETVVVAEVQDSGCGIPAAELAKVFDPFFTTKPAGAGTGLGLTVAKKIIELHAGNIDIRNATGGGVIVTLWFKV
jgi:signal transduction histidine kinase